jgi:hypothetical protein
MRENDIKICVEEFVYLSPLLKLSSSVRGCVKCKSSFSSEKGLKAINVIKTEHTSHPPFKAFKRKTWRRPHKVCCVYESSRKTN